MAIVIMWAMVPDISGETLLPPASPSPFDDRIAALERAALDDAFRQQVAHLYLTWMKDSTEQPQRAVAGERRARKAYIDAMAGIEERERRFHQQH